MMSYVFRGITVSLSMFLLSYCALTLTVGCCCVLLRRVAHRLPPAVLSKALYALQIGPAGVSALLVIAFTVPSFLSFEPTTAAESIGILPASFSLITVFVLVIGMYRAIAAYVQTRRLSREWERHSIPTGYPLEYPVFKTGPDAPPLVVVGLWHPKLLISSSAFDLLTASELPRAVDHESAHIRHLDNFKKLLIRLCCFWRIGGLEAMWLEAVEVAADQNAVKTEHEAMELASALIKVSRLTLRSADLAASFTGSSNSVSMRVERLLAWDGAQKDSAAARACLYGVFAAGIFVVVAAACLYGALLLHVHSFTELLMR